MAQSEKKAQQENGNPEISQTNKQSNHGRKKAGLKKSIVWAFFDLLLVAVSLIVAIAFYNIRPSQGLLIHMTSTLPLLAVLTIAALRLSGIYKAVLRYASLDMIAQVLVSTLSATGVTYLISLVVYLIGKPTQTNLFLMPRPIYLMQWMLAALLMSGWRLLARWKEQGFASRSHQVGRGASESRRILIIGGGYGGATVIRDIQNGRYGNAQAVAVLDDDPERLHSSISRVPVVGGTDEVREIAEQLKADEIVIAIATPQDSLTGLIEDCLSTGCKVKMFTAVQEMNGAQARELNIADLLGRPETHLDMTEVEAAFTGKRVLVTGGGGSIGSELCRQIMGFVPEKLIIYDISENYMYDLLFELKEKYGELVRNTVVLEVGSVRDPESLKRVMEHYRPQIVIHAAAHKHVPLMEGSPEQAILNNVLGTLNTALAAQAVDAERFVLISTDKAVNPTNIMGASKRMAEMIVESIPGGRTVFTAVRFGNVLGSHGSVVPIFERQIRAGGPVTLTHPDIIRYFMTIPEAASLVLQAATMAKGGELYVLDMGQPVRIKDLAERMIQLYGTGDEKIVYTGLRPGEKLYEELLRDEENSTATSRDKIFIAKPERYDWNHVLDMVEELRACVENRGDVKACFLKVVPTYHESSADRRPGAQPARENTGSQTARTAG